MEVFLEYNLRLQRLKIIYPLISVILKRTYAREVLVLEVRGLELALPRTQLPLKMIMPKPGKKTAELKFRMHLSTVVLE